MAEYAAGESACLYDQACFHAQQVAEKAIKAPLVAMNLPPPRTHDLVSLLHLVRPYMEVDDVLFEIADLGPHAVTPRYPSFLAPHRKEDAAQALHHSRRLLEFVENSIRQ